MKMSVNYLTLSKYFIQIIIVVVVILLPFIFYDSSLFQAIDFLIIP